MPTRSEQFRADAQRTGSASASQHAATDAPHEPNGHAERKATYAREAQPANGQPSRRSTRKSANHAKTDTGVVRAEQMKENTPEAQFERTRAHTKGNRPGLSR